MGAININLITRCLPTNVSPSRQMHHSYDTLNQHQTTKMEDLKEFPEEYSKSFQSSHKLLKNFNFRFLENNQTFIQKYWRYLYIIPVVLIHLVSLVIKMATLLSRKQVIEVASMLPPFMVVVHATFKSFVIIPKTSEISTIVKELGVLWRTTYTERQNTEKNRMLKTLRFCNGVNYWGTVVGTIQYITSPLVETLVRIFVLDEPSELLLPIPAAYPFNPAQNWMIYLAVYMFQFYAMFLSVCIYMGPELILITLCALLGNEFVMLQDDLSQVKPTLNTNTGNEECDEHTIKTVVMRHQNLIRLSRQLDNVFNRMIFIDLLFVGITTCAFSFAGQFDRGLTYALNNYVGVVISQITVLCVCYFGELLTRASAGLGDVAYESLWYKGGSQYKRAIWLIIKISQRPCCLTSLKYAAVSLHMFTKVVSTTWSYFSLMNNVYNVEEDE